MRKPIPKIQENEVSVLDAVLGMVDDFDEPTRVHLLRTFLLLLGCVDAGSGRLDSASLTRVVTKLSGGQFQFSAGGD